MQVRRLALWLTSAAAIALAISPTAIGANQAADLRAEHERLRGKFAAAGWRVAPPATGSLVFVANDEYSKLGEGEPLSRKRVADERVEYADAIFGLAQRAAEVGELSLAMQLATEAVRVNPDHAEARRVLGYEERDGRWLTPYGARMADAGKVWHARFGWVRPADVPRYVAGERLVSGRWLSAETESLRRTDIKNGWQVRTDHFLVTTNHGLEAGAELAARLERLHQVWRQLFAGFYLTEREVQQLFAGERKPRAQARPFRVFYHRDRDEYAEALRRRQPRIAETLGIYFDANREAHFFANDVVAGGPPVATLYHEAVHQLFQESKPAARNVGGAANFWVIEGVATYFETLTEHSDAEGGHYYTIGDWTLGRLPAARERLAEGFYVPLAELTRLGKEDVQGHPEIAKLYSQSAGLAAFLMDGEGGRHREALVRYLAAVYAGRDNSQTLAEASGESYRELDAAYRRYVESLP
jgi:hypothetical protein